MRYVLILVAGLSATALAQNDEDAAHRADRRETSRLNQEVLRRAHPSRDTSSAGQQAYRRALDDYEARLEQWRRQVAACEGGQYGACQ